MTFSAKNKDMNTNKLAIYWQNFARVRLQLKFAFIIRPYGFLPSPSFLYPVLGQ